jgi:LmbE family N-acetylglucosaminyl deacetylase
VEVSDPENWDTIKNILVILAHPDDPEFFCGATIARWTGMGHNVQYGILTRGERGGNGRWVDPQELITTRDAEQMAAGYILGVKEITYLDLPDGYLQPTLETRKEVVRLIRRLKPDIVVTCDPTNVFHRENRINHPDHLAAGRIVMEAVFPASGNSLYFPELINEGFPPHSVEEIWFSLTAAGNTNIDTTATWESKINALHQHRSQIIDLEIFDKMMRNRHTVDSTIENPRYEESFRRIIFPR